MCIRDRFHTVVIVVLMVFMTVEIAVEIAVHTVVTVVWIVFNTEETAVEMAVQMVLKVVWILVRTVVKKLETAVNTEMCIRDRVRGSYSFALSQTPSWRGTIRLPIYSDILSPFPALSAVCKLYDQPSVTVH